MMKHEHPKQTPSEPRLFDAGRSTAPSVDGCAKESNSKELMKSLITIHARLIAILYLLLILPLSIVFGGTSGTNSQNTTYTGTNIFTGPTIITGSAGYAAVSGSSTLSGTAHYAATSGTATALSGTITVGQLSGTLPTAQVGIHAGDGVSLTSGTLSNTGVLSINGLSGATLLTGTNNSSTHLGVVFDSGTLALIGSVTAGDLGIENVQNNPIEPGTFAVGNGSIVYNAAGQLTAAGAPTNLITTGTSVSNGLILSGSAGTITLSGTPATSGTAGALAAGLTSITASSPVDGDDEIDLQSSTAGNIVNINRTGSVNIGNRFAPAQCIWVQDSYTSGADLNLRTSVSLDGVSFFPISSEYTGIGTFNDPDIIYDATNKTYYLAATNGITNSGSFNIFSSPDRLNWTFLTGYSPMISGSAGIWVGGPKWFRDPGTTNYSGLHLLFSMQTSGTLNASSFIAETHPIDQSLNAFSNAIEISGTGLPSSYSDGSFVYKSGTYIMFYCNRSISPNQIGCATSTTGITTGYNSRGNIGILGINSESPYPVVKDGHIIRLYLNDFTNNTAKYIESGSDSISVWGSPVSVSSPVAAKGASFHKIADINVFRNLVTQSMIGAGKLYIGSGTFIGASIPAFNMVSTVTNDFNTIFRLSAPNAATGKHINLTIGASASNYNAAGVEFLYSGNGSASNQGQLDLFGTGPALVWNGNQQVGIGGATINGTNALSVNGSIYATGGMQIAGTNVQKGIVVVTGTLANGTASISNANIGAHNTWVQLRTLGTANVGTPVVAVSGTTATITSANNLDSSPFDLFVAP